MTTQYDQLATGYDTWADLPSEQLSHRSINRALGDLSGLSVLDLACGTGHTARLLLSHGAKSVIGVDISPGMIDIAKSTPSPPNTTNDATYIVADCTKPLPLPSSQKFDLVTAMWLFPYAPSSKDLLQMFQNISRHLKPGGRLLGINPNFSILAPSYQVHYGMTSEITGDIPEGKKVRATVHVKDQVTLDAYILRKEIYERCATEAGLEGLRFEEPGWDLLEEGEDRGFWEEWMREPAYLNVSAVKT